jgi:hypothetical protein
MSQKCHICGPVRFEAPAVICASCAFAELDAGREIDITGSGAAVELRSVPAAPSRGAAPAPWVARAWRGMTM